MFELTRRKKIFILVFVDTLLVLIANLFAVYFMIPFVSIDFHFVAINMFFSVFFYLIFGYIFKVFTRINRYTNLKEMVAVFMATTMQTTFSVFILLFINNSYSRRLEMFTYILSTFLIVCSRLVWRLYVEWRNKKNSICDEVKRTLIVGAGEGGRILLNSFFGSKTAGDFNIIGFVDDDPNKKNMLLSGVRVLGNTNQLNQLIKENDIDMVTIAIPSISKKKINMIVDSLHDTKVKVNTMPSIEEIASGKISLSRLKDIDVVDLLGRDEVELDMSLIKDQITNRTILVTGAGGSIGSEICRQISMFKPKKIILLGHGENSIYLIHRELSNSNHSIEFLPVIADIQDRDLIFEIMKRNKPDIVYHAAAHKHVPLMEYNPKEAVKNNVFGTLNVAEAAKENGVTNFVMISTDKANNPPNVMGSTKRIAEMIITSLNENGKTKFSAVRFGNVLGSRGSVIPVFREQISSGGPVTVTDFRMTRYFMTIPEASKLVIQAGTLANGGEIFVLDMGEPVKIIDLAKNMIRLSGYSERDIQIVESGIRPGEKLYEELLLDKEKKDVKVFDKIFIGNIKGFSYSRVMNFIKNLPEDERELSMEVIKFANDSNK
ncbi:polysaccharide biosynthesis protein [Enterococcus gallinarum]|uniref:polysaccharide biosynthesis protein n=1 Tax=Enterococcus gallinarum TaxID=1353 RepID=UPI001AD71BC1|nr:nucleoside-diphosphate sugar epimerase/dehydratase [Enterococcus gallinarum]MBO6419855.1 polysaccharide biosynthesis protein [Enterococcus gallinarum]MBO6422975.1 polysaccharide biosynthesis protein [Enterococcus gallinarum]